MQENNKFYFLQPGSDQAVAIMRVLNKKNSCEVIAVFLENEIKSKTVQLLYSDSITVQDYNDIPSNKVMPFGAASTELLLKKYDITLFDVTMKQSALLVYEKDLFIETCNLNNLPVPKTFLSEDQIKSEDYPLFYKQKYEKGGGVRGIAYTKTELPKKNKSDLIYQEFIDSPGTYGVGFIAKDGVLEVHFSHFESLSYPVSGGSAIKIETYESQRLVKLTAKYIEVSNYSGWGLAEFKWCDKRQDFVFMEINAKLWASCEFSFRNEPAFIHKLFGITTLKEDIPSMIFINRAFNAGLISGLKYFSKKNKSQKVIYPGILRAVIISTIPNVLKKNIKKLIFR